MLIMGFRQQTTETHLLRCDGELSSGSGPTPEAAPSAARVATDHCSPLDARILEQLPPQNVEPGTRNAQL